MEITLRLEEENDYAEVEELTREAFWDVYVPGCADHLVIHNLRTHKDFVKALDFTAVCGNKIVGSIVYCEAKIRDADAEYTVLTFGPLSVLPEYQNKGIGGVLIRHTMRLAKEMGYKAVCIYGEPEYYKRFGFKPSKVFGITNKDGKYPAALLVLELFPRALDGIKGIFDYGTGYAADETELLEFEKRFPPKEKKAAKSQERFNELTGMFL